MSKLDKTKFDKDGAALAMQKRREEKMAKLFTPPTPTQKNYILCLKHGKKYSAKYVNRLYNMVSKHCTLDFEFVCLTEDPLNLNENIKTIPLPEGLTGWWCKPYIFSKDLPIKGTILYIDLDVVIANNIDKLFTYHPNHWCTIRDFTRCMRPGWQKYNSSVVRFQTGQLHTVWERFDLDRVGIQRAYFGDQDYLYDATQKQKPMLYPDSWVLSWKWEVRQSREFKPGGTRGNRVLKKIENVVPRPECCITVFHGDPNPENCEDPWVVDNWR